MRRLNLLAGGTSMSDIIAHQNERMAAGSVYITPGGEELAKQAATTEAQEMTVMVEINGVMEQKKVFVPGYSDPHGDDWVL